MTELIADLFATLDGFAAGEEAGAFFDCPGPDLDAWVRAQLDRPHVVLMGRVTYEAMAGISASAADEISARMTELPKVVFSNTLRDASGWANTRLLSGDLREEIGRLKERSEVPIRTIGSISLTRSLMELGLVDRLRVTIFPLILGNTGREPIFAEYPDVRLDLVGSRLLDSRLLTLDYTPR